MDIDEKFSEVLRSKNKEFCPECNKKIDRGDVAWNNGCTEFGTGYCVLEIICQACDTEVLMEHSWYPDIQDFEEFVEVLEGCI